MSYYHNIGIEDMLGKVFNKISISNTNDEIKFECNEGTYVMYHDQDCCESVGIEDVCGDWNDLVGEPILLAEESTGETPSGYEFEYEPESYTWTFYKFATRKGYVDVRWLGESNGCYSERVSLTFIPNKE